jgi:hypothetical protein
MKPKNLHFEHKRITIITEEIKQFKIRNIYDQNIDTYLRFCDQLFFCQQK